MLEAAMLGIPYAGRLPDFGVNGAAPPGGGGFGGGGAQPLSPGVRHTRALREEQDWAFQASLQVLVATLATSVFFKSDAAAHAVQYAINRGISQ